MGSVMFTASVADSAARIPGRASVTKPVFLVLSPPEIMALRADPHEAIETHRRLQPSFFAILLHRLKVVPFC